MQDDTKTLLKTGTTIFLTVFGGVTHQGPHTNGGWLALMVAMGCVPTGALTLALGLAKLLGELRRD